jgi:hypothetical protein
MNVWHKYFEALVTGEDVDLSEKQPTISDNESTCRTIPEPVPGQGTPLLPIHPKGLDEKDLAPRGEAGA